MMRGLVAALVSLAAGTALAAEPALQIEVLASPVQVRLRGLSAYSDEIAWASGREGTVLRTRDGGKHWDVFKVPGAGELDFRDVQAFGADVALVMGAGPGDASRVYRTADGGRTWTLVLRNPDAEGFFDCMDFNGESGRLLGDPVKGRFQVFATDDGGRSWRWTKGPKSEKDEAAFAASGTCLVRTLGGTAIVTGGAHARVHFLPDRFEGKGDWHALEVPSVPSPSTGLFSVARREGNFVAVGGDYKQERAPGMAYGFNAWPKVAHSHYPANGAEYLAKNGNDLRSARLARIRRWDEVEFSPWQYFEGVPPGYRSGLACRQVQPEDCVATGPGGNDFLVHTQSGYEAQGLPQPQGPINKIDVASVGVASTWQPIPGIGYDSVSIAGDVAWFSGDEGRLGRMQLPAPR